MLFVEIAYFQKSNNRSKTQVKYNPCIWSDQDFQIAAG